MGAAPWGGSEELWSRAAMAALEQKHEIFASVYHWKTLAAPLQHLRLQGATIHERQLYSPMLLVRLSRRIQKLTGLVKSLEQSALAFKPDLICISQGGNLDLSQMKWLSDYIVNSGVPFCIICHNYDPSYLPIATQRQLAKEVFEKACQLYFVSEEQAWVTQRQLAHTFQNVEVIKNPVNLAQTKLLPWPEDPVPQLAIVAGLHIDRKGHDIALEVLSQAKWKQRSWHLNIYGDGPDRDYIEELLLFCQLTDRVTLHGNVSDIAKLWQHNHLLMLPSRREAAPLVVIEAMLCGRPVLATAVGTVPEWVAPGQTGFIAPAATVPLLDAALEQAWAVRAEWPAMGLQAHKWACANADPAAATVFLDKLTSLVRKHTTHNANNS